MSSTDPIGPEGWDAALCRLAELAGARPALSAELVQRIHKVGWEAALVQVLAILEDVRAEDPTLCLEIREDWNAALDAVRARLGQLQAETP